MFAGRKFKLIRPDEALPDLGENFEIDENINGILAPGAQFNPPVIILTDEESLSFRQGKMNVVLYARVLYRDIFMPEMTRETECCFVAKHGGGFEQRGGVRHESVKFFSQGPRNRCT